MSTVYELKGHPHEPKLHDSIWGAPSNMTTSELCAKLGFKNDPFAATCLDDGEVQMSYDIFSILSASFSLDSANVFLEKFFLDKNSLAPNGLENVSFFSFTFFYLFYSFLRAFLFFNLHVIPCLRCRFLFLFPLSGAGSPIDLLDLFPLLFASAGGKVGV